MYVEHPIIGIEIKAKYYFRDHNLMLGNGYLKGKMSKILCIIIDLPTLQAPLVQLVKDQKGISKNAMHKLMLLPTR